MHPWVTLHGGRHRDGSSSLSVLLRVLRASSALQAAQGWDKILPSFASELLTTETGVFSSRQDPAGFFFAGGGCPPRSHSLTCWTPSPSDAPAHGAQVLSEVWKSSRAFVAGYISPSSGFVPITPGHASSSFPNLQVFHQGRSPR